MAPLSVAEPSVASGMDNLKIWFVPKADGVNPLSVAALEGSGATAIDVTYSLTQSGWNRARTQNMIDDARAGRSKTFSRIGTVSETLSIQYVFRSTEDDVARNAFEPGTEGWFVERRGIPNETAATVGQLVSVVPAQLGAYRPDAPASNAVDTITQDVAITNETQDFVPLVA